jgi:hypothetical protein
MATQRHEGTIADATAGRVGQGLVNQATANEVAARLQRKREALSIANCLEAGAKSTLRCYQSWTTQSDDVSSKKGR